MVIPAKKTEYLPGGFLPRAEDDPGFRETMKIVERLRKLGVLQGPRYEIESPYDRRFSISPRER